MKATLNTLDILCALGLRSSTTLNSLDLDDDDGILILVELDEGLDALEADSAQVVLDQVGHVQVSIAEVPDGFGAACHHTHGTMYGVIMMPQKDNWHQILRRCLHLWIPGFFLI